MYQTLPLTITDLFSSVSVRFNLFIMGNGFGSKFFIGQNESHVLFVGLYNSGKTTLLYKINNGKDVTVDIPTIGMTMESVIAKKLHITSTDIGGRDKIRPLLRHYYKMMDAVVFVVDSSEKDHIECQQARDELHKLAAEEELQDVPLLVLANKQDLPGVLSVQQLSQDLGVETLIRQSKREIDILPISALTGEGVFDALEWIERQLKSQKVQEALVKPIQKAMPKNPLASLCASVSAAIKQALTISR